MAAKPQLTITYTLPGGEPRELVSGVRYTFARWIDVNGDGSEYCVTLHKTEQAALRASLPSPLYKGRPAGVVPTTIAE